MDRVGAQEVWTLTATELVSNGATMEILSAGSGTFAGTLTVGLGTSVELAALKSPSDAPFWPVGVPLA